MNEEHDDNAPAKGVYLAVIFCFFIWLTLLEWIASL